MKPTENAFACLTCKSNKAMNLDEMRQHLRSVHMLTEMKGSRTMLLHMDSADRATSVYDIELDGGVKIQQSTIVYRPTIADRFGKKKYP